MSLGNTGGLSITSLVYFWLCILVLLSRNLFITGNYPNRYMSVEKQGECLKTYCKFSPALMTKFKTSFPNVTSLSTLLPCFFPILLLIYFIMEATYVVNNYFSIVLKLLLPWSMLLAVIFLFLLWFITYYFNLRLVASFCLYLISLMLKFTFYSF